ncbi:MAG: tRNA (adenosine(37)-N6)-threonylcarbamoyltransferase complex ATPase subunit type 1 TsaE [Flavobacteriales bacterium]|jgi:tRNA threonylcarbamoyladenosine biosynthesis protein TsaE|nr:tRNA (adenosine(37)-N6)-threonylcarbamoyltransferase complex ATPase subunit type 1 TsaE [Flavobacteriales bacterium]
MCEKYDISNLDDLSSVALELLSLSDNRIFVIEGDLGAGKTTLVKYMCSHLQIIDSVSSPTFPIINEYENSNGDKCFHFDFYRLNNIKEAIMLGVDSYFSSGCYCFIEWPDLIKSLLPPDYHHIKLKEINNTRQLLLLK